MMFISCSRMVSEWLSHRQEHFARLGLTLPLAEPTPIPLELTLAETSIQEWGWRKKQGSLVLGTD